MWLLNCVLKGPRYASLQEAMNPRAVADLLLPARLWGSRTSGRHGAGGGGKEGGRAEFKPPHYALRYRDQKATSQINEAPA